MLHHQSRTLSLRLKIVHLQLFLKITWACLQKVGFKKAGQLRQQLFIKYQRLQGQLTCCRVHRTAGKYHWHYHLPVFPSRAFNRLLENELQVLTQPNQERPLNIAKIQLGGESPANPSAPAKTGKSRVKALQRQDYLNLLEELKAKGVHQIQLCGPAALERFSLLVELILKAAPWATVWLLTDGYKLDEKCMTLLKEAGLKGVSVTLEHHQDEIHNQRIGNPEAFYWAEQAILHAQAKELATAWHLQPHPAETTPQFIDSLMQKAKELGVHYVQLSDFPKPQKALPSTQSLAQRQHNLLEEAYIKYNHQTAEPGTPTFVYMGYHQRRIGCFYHLRSVNYNAQGQLEPCAFCYSNANQEAYHIKKQHLIHQASVQHKAAFF